jgi:hypothetical protein
MLPSKEEYSRLTVRANQFSKKVDAEKPESRVSFKKRNYEKN